MRKTEIFGRNEDIQSRHLFLGQGPSDLQDQTGNDRYFKNKKEDEK